MPTIEDDDELLLEVTKQSIAEARINGMSVGAIVRKYKISQRRLNSFLKQEIRNYLTTSTMDDAQGVWRDLSMSRLEAIVEQIFPLLVQSEGLGKKAIEIGSVKWKVLLDSFLRVINQQAELVGTPTKGANDENKIISVQDEPEMLAIAKSMGIPTD